MKTLQFLRLCFVSLALLAGSVAVAVDKSDASASQATVNINTADALTLAQVLDGVGLVKAEAIVEHRKANGNFSSAEELTEVQGIGKATLERNKDKILVK